MHYIVFDLEWNIASRATPVDAQTQAAMPFEIIEIGAVKLDEHYEIVGEFTTHVRPKIYKVLSSHIAAVTHRFQQSLKFGLPFPEAAQEFFKWIQTTGDDYAFCIWSESDPAVLRSNLAFHGLPDSLPLQCLDVQHVFDDIVEQSGQQRSSNTRSIFCACLKPNLFTRLSRMPGTQVASCRRPPGSLPMNRT